MQIGPYSLSAPVVVAPMAGVSDQPFRQLCLRMGAGMAVSEMMSANPETWGTDKSLKRMYLADEPGIRAVQIVGSEPDWMADAARRSVSEGAQIIDINMGCPAKKINRRLAGSALLQDPALVREILQTVVAAVDVPVTLKIRTGWDTEHRNGVEIAEIAESCGVQALTVHGRTRACLFNGQAEYDTIRAIKQHISIPVVANGDIDTPQKALAVLEYTGADAIMIGRAAQGQPWLFNRIRHFLTHGSDLPSPEWDEVKAIVLEHVAALHQFYGEAKGVRFARKHVAWYLEKYESAKHFRRGFNTLTSAEEQLDALKLYFSNAIA
ncbi:tRNA dihydrouridine synthase DusB [uncultured Tolumonas sp.]|jgi:putative TIM-barrel protein, nifR3 family|uniref:tRNA dihydrouridine synthase DusB n=1 Tax=uncultured Tolumonas sp. TaxID=263765 RepID=UPI00292DD6E4|nr:tRNA dihydrouridine synthase DusB [uncultured Tolumonas sp.]